MNNDELIRRGGRAQQLLQDPMISEAFELIEKQILDEWEACPVRDTEGRELLWKYYKTAKKFRGYFEGVVESGKVGEFREKQSIMDKTVNLFKGKQHA